MNVKLWIPAAAVVVLAACSGSSKGGLSVSAKGAATAPPAAKSTLDGGNGLTIDRVRLVVRKVEVEGENATCTPATTPTAPATGMAQGAAGAADHGGDGSGGDGSDDGEECEIEAGPFLVDLSGAALVGGIHFAFDVPVPAGTYEELKFKIDTLSAEKAAAAPVEAQRAGLAELAGLHASVAVDGTLDGTAPFHFTAALETTQKREGSIVVDAQGAALTLDVDPSHWFQAADGSKLDPTDPGAVGAILANIRASVRVVHDEDHDGHDDEQEGHGGGGHDLVAAP